MLTNMESFLFSHPIYQLATSTMNSNFVNECFICLNMQIFNFSVTKATLQLQMSVCLSVISQNPQQLEIFILHHSSFITHHLSFISRLLSFSACFFFHVLNHANLQRKFFYYGGEGYPLTWKSKFLGHIRGKKFSRFISEKIILFTKTCFSYCVKRKIC